MSSCPPWLFVALVQHLPTSIRSTWPPRVEDVASRAGACEAVAVAGAGPASTGPATGPATRPATRPATEDSPAAELAAGAAPCASGPAPHPERTPPASRTATPAPTSRRVRAGIGRRDIGSSSSRTVPGGPPLRGDGGGP